MFDINPFIHTAQIVLWYLGSQFSLSAVFLATVDGLHHYPLISQFPSCSTSRSFIHMRQNVSSSMALKTLGYQETALLSSLLPGCDWSYVHLTLAYITSQFHSVLGHGYGHRLVADPHCMSSGCTHHDSFLSWIDTIFLMAMTLLMESRMDLRCIVGSGAQSSFLSMYNSWPGAFLVQD